MAEEGSEDYEDEQISAEEKLQVFQNMMKRVPAGEAGDVVGIFQDLLNKDEDLVDDTQKALSLQGRALQCHTPIDGVVICEQTRIGEENTFLDAKNGQACEVDFLTSTVKRSDTEYPNSEKRQALQTAVEKYAKAHYLTGAVKGYNCCVVEQESGDMVILITAEYRDTPNKLTGSWASTFTVSGQNLKGTTTVNAHYFEGGNTQLKNTTTYSEDLEDDTADSVVAALKLVETEMQQKLLSFFTSAENHWGKVRRMLTIQGTKFQWNLTKHSLVSGQSSK